MGCATNAESYFGNGLCLPPTGRARQAADFARKAGVRTGTAIACAGCASYGGADCRGRSIADQALRQFQLHPLVLRSHKSAPAAVLQRGCMWQSSKSGGISRAAATVEIKSRKFSIRSLTYGALCKRGTLSREDTATVARVVRLRALASAVLAAMAAALPFCSGSHLRANHTGVVGSWSGGIQIESPSI